MGALRGDLGQLPGVQRPLREVGERVVAALGVAAVIARAGLGGQRVEGCGKRRPAEHVHASLQHAGAVRVGGAKPQAPAGVRAAFPLRQRLRRIRVQLLVEASAQLPRGRARRGGGGVRVDLLGRAGGHVYALLAEPVELAEAASGLSGLCHPQLAGTQPLRGLGQALERPGGVDLAFGLPA